MPSNNIFLNMVTAIDIFNLVSNRIGNEALKGIIRENFSPYEAADMCNAIDSAEKIEHFKRFLEEWNEWMLNQQRQQVYRSLLFRQCYYGR